MLWQMPCHNISKQIAALLLSDGLYMAESFLIGNAHQIDTICQGVHVDLR